MMCPLERSGRWKLEVDSLKALPGRGSGADDETARCIAEGNGKEDHLVGCGRDHRSDGSDDAPVARKIGRGRLQRASRSAQRQAEREAGTVGHSGEGSAAV